jgi:hypothetical protein
MSKLEQTVLVKCPLTQAAMRLRNFFRDYGNPNGDAARLILAIEVEIPGLPIPLRIKRPVIATIQPQYLAGDPKPRYKVQWAPEEPGPFPLFAGELVVEGTPGYDAFFLLLRGEYTPPFGALGLGFDMVAGNKIAHGTASDLLYRMRAAIERDFRADEERKQPALPEPEGA